MRRTIFTDPVGGDPGAHGRFDDAGAQRFSPQLWTSLHRDWVIGGVLTAALLTAGLGAFFAGQLGANPDDSRPHGPTRAEELRHGTGDFLDAVGEPVSALTDR